MPQCTVQTWSSWALLGFGVPGHCLGLGSQGVLSQQGDLGGPHSRCPRSHVLALRLAPPPSPAPPPSRASRGGGVASVRARAAEGRG